MIHCPTCGSGLRFDIASQKTVCDHCRNSFEPESLPDSVYDDADTAQAFEGFAFMCPDCGAELMTTDSNDAVGFCPYCGGASVIHDRLRQEWKPNQIIPFSITKEQCKEIYVKEVKKNIFVSRKYRDPQLIEGLIMLNVELVKHTPEIIAAIIRIITSKSANWLRNTCGMVFFLPSASLFSPFFFNSSAAFSELRPSVVTPKLPNASEPVF